MQPTETTPEVAAAINRCAEAYRAVRAQLPKDAGYHAGLRNQQIATCAYCAQLPVLHGPASFQIYMACIGSAVGVGAIDIVDVGRYCHIANVAMAAWKLTNLTIPAAEAKERRAQARELREQSRELREQERHDRAKNTPTPPKGNHSAPGDGLYPSNRDPQAQETHHNEGKSNTPTPTKGNQALIERLREIGREREREIAAQLPDWETQKQYFQKLRERGECIPSDEQLRRNPFQAHYLCGPILKRAPEPATEPAVAAA